MYRSFIILPALLVATGCESMNHAERGVVGGGLLGAGAGAIIGSATGNTAAGAAIGAATGGVAGGLIGNEIDDSEKKIRQASAEAPAVRGPLSLQEVATMATQGISDAVIIGQIRSTRSIYNLTPSDISYLKQYNVSDAVVLEMQATANRVPHRHPRVYARPYCGPDVVIVEPPPPPVGIGFSYTHVHRR